MWHFDHFFPTPVWWTTTNIDTDSIEKLVYKLYEQDTKGRYLSNQGGWQSMDFRPGTYPEMKPLEDLILEQAQRCIIDYGYNQDAGFIVIENLWANINKKGDTNSVHIHDNSFISGAFYVKATPDQGGIIFYKDYNADFIVASRAPIEQHTAISASAIRYEAETGKILIFPGNLPHGVERNSTDEDRISISWNVKYFRTDDDRYFPKNS